MVEPNPSFYILISQSITYLISSIATRYSNRRPPPHCGGFRG